MASAAVSSASAATRPPSNCSTSMSSWPPGRASWTRCASGWPRCRPCGSPHTRGSSGSISDGNGGATLVSEYVKGWRLADLLDVAETENLTFDIGVVMLLLRQLLPTAAMLSSQSRDYRQRSAGARAPAAHAPGPHRAHRLRPWPGNRGPRLGFRAAVALAAGGDGVSGRRRPDRLAARRRGAGGRHHAVAGDRPPAARRRVPRAPRSAGGQRAPADADRCRCAALRRAAHLADPRPAAPSAQLRVALRRPARARAAARHRVRAHRATRRARSGHGAPRAADAGLRAAGAAGRVVRRGAVRHAGAGTRLVVDGRGVRQGHAAEGRGDAEIDIDPANETVAAFVSAVKGPAGGRER